jgi:hypothetical protein
MAAYAFETMGSGDQLNLVGVVASTLPPGTIFLG